MQDVALSNEVVEVRIGAEPQEVQLLGRVHHCRRDPRGFDLRPIAVLLSPEACAPGVIEVVQVAVASAEPRAERLSRGLAVAMRVDAAVLVVRMPQSQRWMTRVAYRELFGDPRGSRPVGG